MNNLIPTLLQLTSEVDYIYEPIPHLYNSTLMFVYLKDGVLRIKVAECILSSPDFSDAKVISGFEELEAYLIENMFDVTRLYSVVYQNVLNKAVLRKQQLSNLTTLVGEDAILECENKWNEFGTELMKVIRKSNMRIL